MRISKDDCIFSKNILSAILTLEALTSKAKSKHTQTIDQIYYKESKPFLIKCLLYFCLNLLKLMISRKNKKNLDVYQINLIIRHK